MALLSCRGVSLGYDGRAVVSGVDFQLGRNDYLCIVGENGSGKSTLVKGLLRLIQPLEGQIALGCGVRPSGIGYLPQQAASQRGFPASVCEVVLSGRLNSLGLRPFYTRADREAALKNMCLLEIEDLKGRCFGDLSGGQQQRVLLARAMCAANKLLLLDEPVSGLDPVVTRDFYEIVKRVNGSAGIAVIMVSHDIASAVKYASHILHLKSRQEFFGTTAEYLASDIGRYFTAAQQE